MAIYRVTNDPFPWGIETKVGEKLVELSALEIFREDLDHDILDFDLPRKDEVINPFEIFLDEATKTKYHEMSIEIKVPTENRTQRQVRLLKLLLNSCLMEYGGTNLLIRNKMARAILDYEGKAKRPIQGPEDLRIALSIKNLGNWTEFLDRWLRCQGRIKIPGPMRWEDAQVRDDASRVVSPKYTGSGLDALRKYLEKSLKEGFAEGGDITGHERDKIPKKPAPWEDIKDIGVEGLNPETPEISDLPSSTVKEIQQLMLKADKAVEDNGKLKEKVKELESKSSGIPLKIEILQPDKKEVVRINAAHSHLPKLLARMQAGVHTYMVGPAGSGKTTAAEQVAEALKLAFGFMSVGPQTTKTDILGYMNATGGYVTTEFRKRYEQGGIFLFDEMDAGNPGVLTCVNAALANGSAAFPDGMVRRHDSFRCLAAGNTFGTGPDRSYVGRQEMDAASIDRFNFLEWPYDEVLEKSLALQIGKDPILSEEWFNTIVKVRRAVDHLHLRHVVSPRATLNGLRLLEANVPRDEVMTSQVWKSLKPDDIGRIEKQMSKYQGSERESLKTK